MVGVAQDSNYWVRRKRPWIGEKKHIILKKRKSSCSLCVIINKKKKKKKSFVAAVLKFIFSWACQCT